MGQNVAKHGMGHKAKLISQAGNATKFQAQRQAIMRTIGKRKEPEISLDPRCPTEAERAWVRSMAENVRLQVPKGVFRYASHEQANLEWETWMGETMAAMAQESRDD